MVRDATTLSGVLPYPTSRFVIIPRIPIHPDIGVTVLGNHLFLGHLIPGLSGVKVQKVRKGLAGGFLGQGLIPASSSAAGGLGSAGLFLSEELWLTGKPKAERAKQATMPPRRGHSDLSL